ncbi:hypothetical protein Pan216_25560 [Planctomycetes bacterium Pan216]|uniref:H repeat-associated protein N-terminal domain-containing protein n=1 Tax=Kolteria novifilia TaxID=2527975 RepID=A0A518B412_9BACT|nr:hypothetical protein Pan216_25560 [Planctomycetes bacterium Pan216]
MSKDVRVTLEDVITHFEDLEDPRSTINQRHPLISVVVIAVMGVLAGASGPTGIAKWARMKKDLLLESERCNGGVLWIAVGLGWLALVCREAEDASSLCGEGSVLAEGRSSARGERAGRSEVLPGRRDFGGVVLRLAA